MSLIIIFVDGVGIGQNNNSFNPCLNSKHKIFSHINNLPYKGIQFALDAKLELDGFPQSATGQTSIYTGMNAAKHIGKHLFGFPNNKLKELLKNHSIFVKLVAKKYKCKFINAFRPVFFTTPELFKDLSLSTTSEMNRAAGLSFSSLKDLKNRDALYHDFTNQELKAKGFNIPVYDHKMASDIIIKQANKNDLILYEYFLTDTAGHSKNMHTAVKEINKIESLIFEVVKKSSLLNHSVIVCSDHGNIEDLRVKSHTYNPAFFAVWTNQKLKAMFSLLDIYPAVLELVKKPIQLNSKNRLTN